MTQPIHERVAAVRQRATEASTVEELRACITDLCDAINETMPKMTDYFGEKQPREWLEVQAQEGMPGASTIAAVDSLLERAMPGLSATDPNARATFHAGMAALKDRT